MPVVGPRNGSLNSGVHTAVIGLGVRRSIRRLYFSIPFLYSKVPLSKMTFLQNYRLSKCHFV